jgi:tetratricopeptide (TPR) repeat protein
LRDHPAPSLLHRFLNGGLSKTEEPAVVRHLLAGCSHCREQLGPETGRLLSQDLPPQERGPDPELERPLQGAVEGAACHRIEASELKARARKLHRLLVVHGLDRAPVAGIPAAVIVEALLGLIWDLRHENPEQMAFCGQLAVWVARSMPEVSPQLEAGLRTRAWAECANALRVSARLPESLVCLEQAEEWVLDGAGDPALRLRLKEIRASLYCSQQRYAEAAELAEEVLQARLRLGDLAGAARAMIKKAVYAGYGGRFEEELQLLEASEFLVDEAGDPELRGFVLHNKIYTLVELGRAREAWALLEANRGFLLKSGGSINRVKLLGVEARIHVVLRRLALAEQRLRTAKQAFFEARIRTHEALATLDLATVVMRQGGNRYPEAIILAIEALRTFAVLNLQPHVVEALLLLSDAVQQGLVTAVLLQSVADFVRRAEHDGQARYQPQFE